MYRLGPPPSGGGEPGAEGVCAGRNSSGRESKQPHRPGGRWGCSRWSGRASGCRRPLRRLSAPRGSRWTSSIGSPLPGLSRLPELSSVRRSGVSVCRLLLAVFTASRSSVVRPGRARRRRPAPPDLDLPLRDTVAEPALGPKAPGGPPWGFVAPPALIARVRFTRVCLTRHVPPPGFLTPSAACSPCVSTLPREGQRSWGSTARHRPPPGTRRFRGGPDFRPSDQRCSSPPSSEEQEVECSAGV